MAQPSVSAGYARGLIEFAATKGVARAALLEGAGLDGALLGDLNARVPFPKYIELMRAAKALSGDPALALHFGEAANLTPFSILSVIGNASETIAEAFVQFNRFVRLLVDVDGDPNSSRFQLTRRAGGLWLSDTRANPNAFFELTESAFAQMLCSTRQFGNRSWALAVHVTHADPGYRAEYERIFQAPVVFGAARNELLVDAAWLSTKVSALPPDVGKVVSERAAALLDDLDRSRTARGRVETALSPLLSGHEASMDRIAAALKVSRQTLYRQLKAEGVTFETVLDELRRSRALARVRESAAALSDIADELGFSDPAAFSRAFRRWTGASPRVYRASSGSEGRGATAG